MGSVQMLFLLIVLPAARTSLGGGLTSSFLIVPT
jgi:hypothetical protein